MTSLVSYPTNFRRWLTIWLFCLLGGFVLTTSGCLDDEEDDLIGNWVRRSDFEGIPRTNAVAFAIGNFGYVGLGYDGDEDLRDFWRYDVDRDFWTQMDPFPGPPRQAAVAFSVGGKGYVGTGFDSEDDEYYQDFYAFDPTAGAGEQWTRIPDFPGSARYNATAFADENSGYVGSGYDDNWLKDFYAYDPEQGTWRQIVSLGGSKRENAIAFTIDGFHYVGTGRNNGLAEQDFWRYAPQEDRWERLLDLDEEDDYAIERYGGVSFVLNGRGYVATGTNGFNSSSVWEYLPANDEWEEKTAFEGVSRQDAVAFVAAGRAFLTTGRSGATQLDDLREFLPLEEADEDD
ncbi:MAG: kelch repeat-containing protein [Bacteroidota bacterium]